jgi:hypothetical protein
MQISSIGKPEYYISNLFEVFLINFLLDYNKRKGINMIGNCYVWELTYLVFRFDC